MRKIIAFFIVLLLATPLVSIAGTTALLQDGHTFYVGGSGPGNYSHIQDALDNTTDGDTVIVYAGTYAETLIIDTSILLLGEDRTTTIIDGGKKGDVVMVIADHVTISGFTITNGGRPFYSFKEGGGIRLDPSSYSVITDNIVKNNDFFGILSVETTSSHNTISYNMVSMNGREDYKKRSYFNIGCIHSPFNTISHNIIENALGLGMSCCYWSVNTTIYGNIFRNNTMGGIRSRHSFNNHIYNNLFENNSLFGLRILNESDGNIIEYNTFLNNKPLDAFFDIAKPFSRNTWKGNYWTHARVLPKVILGHIRPAMKIAFGIPWVAIDWRPAHEPIPIE